MAPRSSPARTAASTGPPWKSPRTLTSSGPARLAAAAAPRRGAGLRSRRPDADPARGRRRRDFPGYDPATPAKAGCCMPHVKPAGPRVRGRVHRLRRRARRPVRVADAVAAPAIRSLINGTPGGRAAGGASADTPDPRDPGAPSTPGFLTAGVRRPRPHYTFTTRLFIDAAPPVALSASSVQRRTFRVDYRG